MVKRFSDPVHCWLVWRKAHEAAQDYLLGGIEETGISDTVFRVLEALLHKGPLLFSRAESPNDRRVRIVALTKSGKDLIVPIFRKHSAEIGRVFADANAKDLQILESVLKKTGKRAYSCNSLQLSDCIRGKS